MSASLPPAFLTRPIAHRAYHGSGAPENSPAAIRRAIAKGYGIEIDVQLSRDGQALVFHDDALNRLTAASGPVRDITAQEAAAIPLKGGSDTIPSLPEVLDLVAGRVPLLIEIKDQDGDMGPDIGALETATLAALEGYHGPVACMSFNPFSVTHMACAAPDRAIGLVSMNVDHPLSGLSAVAKERLRDMQSFEDSGASFISHAAGDLDAPRVAEIKASGAPILCWTIRSCAEEEEARKIADNVTFEGYAAAFPA